MKFYSLFLSFIALSLASTQSALSAVPENYTLSNTMISGTSQGGSSHFGGGGAGLGGGVFIYHADTLSLTDVIFSGCTAQGGNINNTELSAGGGGGFGGGSGGSGGNSAEGADGAGGGGGFGVVRNNTITPGRGGNGGGDNRPVEGGGGGGGGFGSIGNDGLSVNGGDGKNFTNMGEGDGGMSNGNDGMNGTYFGDGGGGATQGGNGGDGGGGGNNASGGPGGGTGGFGGGGGNNFGSGFVNGGRGGFGGGGGDNLNSGAGGGTGGFGGGAGSSSTPGFGGGISDSGSGGGGAGLGGALFLHAEGASGSLCTIQNSITFQGNSATGGTGFGNGESLGQDIFMMSGSQLTVENLSISSTVPTPIEGNIGQGVNPTPILNLGGLTLDTGNTAIFTLNGDNTYTGITTVNSGTLYVDGSLITPVILNEGMFGGIETRVKVHADVPNSGNLTVNGGTVHPGGDNMYGNLYVEGNLDFNGGGMLNAEVDSVGNTDSITAVGTAKISGELDVEGAAGNFLKGQVITIIEAAGGRSGTFSKVTVPFHLNGASPLFKVQYTDNAVQLVVRDDQLFVDQSINKGNPQAVVDYMKAQLPIDPNSDFGFVLNSLGLVPDDQINEILNSMDPSAFGLFESINLTTNAQIMRIFSGHLHGGSTLSPSEPLSLTAAAGDRPFYPKTPVRRGCERDANKHNNGWVQPFGTWNTQKKQGDLRGVDYESAGIVAGYDYLFDNFYVGGGLGYAYTDFRWKDSAGKGHINQVYGAIYGSYFIKYFAATLSTMVGGNFYNTDRYIKYSAPGHPGASTDRTAHSHSSGIQWTNHLGLIGDLNPLSVPLQIFGNLDHFYLHNGSFNESGADSINLRVKTKVSNALRSELGISSSYTFQVGGGCWTPSAQLSWVNKTPLSSSSYRGGFIGQRGTFSVNTTSKGINQWAPGLGIEFANGRGFSLLLNGRAELNSSVKNYFADIGMDYAF